MVSLWVNVEYVEVTGYSRIFGPYKTEEEAFRESKVLAESAGRTIHDYIQVELG